MERPTADIEKLRNIGASGIIDPRRTYRFDVDAQIMEWTGVELIELSEAIVTFADAQERGDKKAMLAAMKRISMT
jgi:hypothetical protein